jgi:hypothetical protein
MYTEITVNINCVSCCSLQFVSEMFTILRRSQRETITNARRSVIKVPVVLVGF